MAAERASPRDDQLSEARENLEQPESTAYGIAREVRRSNGRLIAQRGVTVSSWLTGLRPSAAWRKTRRLQEEISLGQRLDLIDDLEQLQLKQVKQLIRISITMSWASLVMFFVAPVGAALSAFGSGQTGLALAAWSGGGSALSALAAIGTRSAANKVRRVDVEAIVRRAEGDVAEDRDPPVSG